MKISNILVPVDFSECSTAAFKHALELAAIFASKVFLINVVDSRHIERIAGFCKIPMPEVQEKTMHDAKLSLNDFISKCNDTKATCIAEVSSGVPFHEIALAARKNKVDLIVMGGYGQRGKGGQLDEIFFGSTAEKVVRLLPCPILCVPIPTV